MNINIAYLNDSFLPMEEIHISPDDRGFLFADGIYEVVRWYPGFFYDLESHMERLKKGLKKILITWKDADSFPAIAQKLIENNNLTESNALIYLQVTRGLLHAGTLSLPRQYLQQYLRLQSHLHLNHLITNPVLECCRGKTYDGKSAT